jgi:hypothetical protein
LLHFDLTVFSGFSAGSDKARPKVRDGRDGRDTRDNMRDVLGSEGVIINDTVEYAPPDYTNEYALARQ